jgi:TadE-like protein
MRGWLKRTYKGFFRISQSRSIRRNEGSRRAAATVEFALIAPVFLTVVMGTTETSRMFNVQTQVAVAAREGARLAAMDREDFLEPGECTNEKIIDDIKHFLSMNGLPGESAAVSIVHHSDHTTPFDFDDPDNDWELFELTVSVPYTAVTSWYSSIGGSGSMVARVVFRNGRARMSG